MRICVNFSPIGLFLCFIFFSVQGFSQIIDNFNDGDFTTNPSWSGSSAKFQINSAKQLQLSGLSATDTAYLTTSSTLIDNVQWDFWVKMAFSPSTSNYLKIYLVSDQANLKSLLNGYYLRIGESGSLDGIDLYRQSGKSSFKIMDGINGHAAKSSNTLRIRVTRDNTGNWTVFSDTLGGNNLALEGTTFDNGYTTSNYFGFSCRYSSSNKTKFYFDDVSVKLIPVDTIAPKIDSVVAVAKNQCNVYFNEPIDVSTAESLANYNVNNGLGQPNTAVLDGTDPQIVHLSFSGSFIDNLSNTLTTTSIKDIKGNLAAVANTIFVYHAPIVGVKGDIIINEIYPDPTPTVGLPASEYVELYNRSNKSLSLKGWKFTDGSTTSTLTSFTLAPKNYLILVANADTSGFSSFGKVLGLSSFPSLNNTGDNLSLLNDSSELIDNVVYSDKWYKDAEKDFGGWSLERISAGDSSCRPISNWTASLNPQGGTPGKQNSVFSSNTDNSAPQIIALRPLSLQRLRVTFSKPADSLSLTNLTSYSLNGFGNPSSVYVSTSDWNEVILTFSKSFAEGMRYTLTVDNIKDCAGRSAISSFDFYMGVNGKQGDIVITELYPDPSPSNGLPEQEFIEIYNRSKLPIQLGGWKLSDATSSVTLDSTIILPLQYAILCSFTNSTLYNPFGKTIALDFMPSLNNDGDNLSIYNANGELIDGLSYNSGYYHDDAKKDGGWTIERVDENFVCYDPLNWKASVNAIGGTPGKSNSVQAQFTDQSAPVLQRASALNDSTVSLYFSELTDTSVLTNKSNYQIIPSLGIKTITEGLTTKLHLSDRIQRQQIYTITVSESLTDCSGNRITKNTAKMGLSEALNFGDLSINEVLFNPYPNTPDFVELVNISSKIINASSIKLANKNSSGEVSAVVQLKDSSYLLFPGDYLAITTDIDKLKATYNRTDLNHSISSSLPSLNDDKGCVILLSGNNIIDEFNYTDNMHFPLLKDKEGVSLEKSNPTLSSAISSNWHSAAETAGFATPGYKNSEYSDMNGSATSLTIDPPVFSPDDDGYHDILNIFYHFDKPGKIGSVTIYNTSGQPVRKLVQNELLATDGNFSWDGLDDTRSKAATGIYIVYTEIVDASGAKEVKKNSCVLGTKL